MNKIEFRICIRENYLQIRSVIDGIDLYGNEHLGIALSDFFTQKNFFGGELLIGICCCGCEGCDDYTVDVSLQGNSIVWSDWRAKSEYIFDKCEYEKAIEMVRMNHYRHVEKHVSNMLRQTMTKEQYVFNWASVTLKENVITLNYSKPDTKQPDTVQKIYEIEWSENDKWDIEKIKPRIQRFIRIVLQEGEYMVDTALEIAYNILYDNTLVVKNRHSNLFNHVKVALNCKTQQEKIVALLYSDPPLVCNSRTSEDLKEEGFTSDVINAIECLMKLKGYQPRKEEKYDRFLKRVLANDIAFQVAKNQNQVKDGNKENRINKALEIAWNTHSEQLGKDRKPYILHLIRKALHCNTEDEKIEALLRDDITKDIKLIKEIKI